MITSRQRPVSFFLKFSLALVLLPLLQACGGGGGATQPTTPWTPPPPILAWQVTPQLGSSEVGVPYQYQLKVTGGVPPYTYSASSEKPAWLNIDASSGAISGTPSDKDVSSSFQIFASDSKSASITANVTLYVAAGMKVNPMQSTIEFTANVPCNWSNYIIGGLGPFTMSATGIPAGVSFQNTGGNWFYVQGTPTTPGTYPVTVSVSDSLGGQLTFDFTILIDNKIVVKPANFVAIQGRPFTGALQISNGTLPYNVTATMPLNLSMASDGTISGIPLSGSNSPYSSQWPIPFTITDSSDPQQTYTGTGWITLYGPVRFVSNAITLHTGESYFQGIATGGFGAVAVSATSGSLPPGIAISSAFISGTPTTEGTYTATLHAQDSATPPQYADQTVTFTVVPPVPVIDQTQLPEGAVNQPYSAQLKVRSGGAPPFTWKVTGTLPAGLTVDSSGNIQGTPTETGDFPINVQVTDSSSPAQTQQGYNWVRIRLAPATKLGRNDTIATATPMGTGGIASISPYSDPSSSGPDQDYYKLYTTAGSIVQIDVRALSGSPIDPVLEIVDANGLRYKTCNDPADDNPDASTGIATDPTPNGYDDDCMNDDVIMGVNRNSHLDFKVPGTAGQQVTFYAHVFDWSGQARPDFQYSFTVAGDSQPLSVPRYVVMNAVNGTAITSPVATLQTYPQGGTGPYTFGVSSPGSLPPGVTMDSTGKFAGTPTTTGRYAFNVQVTDSSSPSQTGTIEVDFNIADPIVTPTTMPSATTGVLYSQTMPISGGTYPYQIWSVQFLPQQCCLWLGSSGSLGGVPKNAGDFQVQFNIADATMPYGPGVNRSFTIHIDAGPLTLAAPTPQRGKVYNYYELQLSQSGGSAPIAYAITGAMPPGLVWDSNQALISGYPTAAGTYSFSVTATDSKSVQSPPVALTIVVDP